MNVYRVPPDPLPSTCEPSASACLLTIEGLEKLAVDWWAHELECRERASLAPCPAFVVGEQQPIRWPYVPPSAKDGGQRHEAPRVRE